MHPRISITGSVGPSVGPSVSRLVTLSSKTREIDIFDQIIKKNHVTTSSCNNFISKRSHRWPYGPCFDLTCSKTRNETCSHIQIETCTHTRTETCSYTRTETHCYTVTPLRSRDQEDDENKKNSRRYVIPFFSRKLGPKLDDAILMSLKGNWVP